MLGSAESKRTESRTRGTRKASLDSKAFEVQRHYRGHKARAKTGKKKPPTKALNVDARAEMHAVFILLRQ